MSPFEQASVNMNTYRPTIILIISYQNARIEEINACAYFLATNNRNLGMYYVDGGYTHERCMHNACVPNGLFQVYWITRQESIDFVFFGALQRNPSKITSPDRNGFDSIGLNYKYNFTCFDNNFDSISIDDYAIWHNETIRECSKNSIRGDKTTTLLLTQAKHFLLASLPISVDDAMR